MRYVIACKHCKREDDVSSVEDLIASVSAQANAVRSRINNIINACIPNTRGIAIVFRLSCPACDTSKEQKYYFFDVARIK
jgi:hypothetical protein